MPRIEIAALVQSKQSFTVTTELTTISSSNETALLYLKNPSASNKIILTSHFKHGTDSSNVRSVVRIYFNPTVTANGTALTIINTYVAASPPASGMEVYKLPTVTDNGTILNLDIAPANVSSKGLNRFYFVDPGNTILATVTNSSANAKTFSDVYWVEDL